MLTLQDIEKFMRKLDNWSLEGNSIVKVETFNSFKESLDYVIKIGSIAEKVEHYPDIILSMNTVRISLTTHNERGLTQKDFEMAEQIDQIKEAETKDEASQQSS